MQRRVVILLGCLLIVFLTIVMGSAITSTTQELRPGEFVEGEYEGEHVTVKGRIADIEDGADTVHFTIEGYEGSVPAEYDGSVPTTFEPDRFVIAEGVIDGGVLKADTVKVQAHLDEDRPRATD